MFCRSSSLVGPMSLSVIGGGAYPNTLFGSLLLIVSLTINVRTGCIVCLLAAGVLTSIGDKFSLKMLSAFLIFLNGGSRTVTL